MNPLEAANIYLEFVVVAEKIKALICLLAAKILIQTIFPCPDLKCSVSEMFYLGSEETMSSVF